jgi:hypothetical protein
LSPDAFVLFGEMGADRIVNVPRRERPLICIALGSQDASQIRQLLVARQNADRAGRLIDLEVDQITIL